MARPKKQDDYALAEQMTNDMVKKEEEVDINDMPLNTLGDYLRYNKRAREINKKLRIARHPIKQCPIELHPKEKVEFNRNDQPNNPCMVHLSNEMIHFHEKLYPGKQYELPRCVVEHLASLGTNVWHWVTNGDGSKETKVSHKTPRFSIRTIYG